MRTRSAGWIAGSILIGAALLVPAAALAQEGNQTNVNSETWGGNLSCTGGPDGDFTVTPNQVVWVFVHASTDATSGTLTANFAGAGQVTAQSYIQGGIKYAITTARPETLLNFSDTIAGGVLTLSHICRNDTPTPPPTNPPTTPPTNPPTTPPTTPPTNPPTTPPTNPPTATPSSSVEAVTGTPRITPPPTDSMGGGSTSGDGWGIAMIALGVLAALALLASPVRRRRNR